MMRPGAVAPLESPGEGTPPTAVVASMFPMTKSSTSTLLMGGGPPLGGEFLPDGMPSPGVPRPGGGFLAG